MNEVGFSQAHSQMMARANASSKGAEAAQQSNNGKDLPIKAERLEKPEDVETTKEPQAQEGKSESLDNVVATVNDYVQSIQRDLQFSVDKELEKTVVKVVDSDSGEVIRQIPEDVFLELARNLKQNGELQLVNARG